MALKMYFEGDKLIDSNILIKVGKIEHLKQLQQGKIYMNKLEYFRKCESDGLGDKEEGLVSSGSEGIVTVAGVEIAGVKNFLLYAYSNNPVFCVLSVPFQKESDIHYSFTPDKKLFEEFVLDSENEYGVILIQKDAFVHKIKQKMETNSIGWLWDEVIYTDEKAILPKEETYKVVFRKRTKFAHQHEWRLLLFHEVDDHYELDIGDLSNCSQILPIKNIDRDMKIEAYFNEKNEK